MSTSTVADGIDCDCRGDRWYPVNDDDAQDQPSSYGYGGAVTVYSDGDNYTDYSEKSESWVIGKINLTYVNRMVKYWYNLKGTTL